MTEERSPIEEIQQQLRDRVQVVLGEAFLGEPIGSSMAENIRRLLLEHAPEGTEVEVRMVDNEARIRITPPQIVTVTYTVIKERLKS